MKRAITLALAFGLCAAPIAAQDIPLSEILVANEGWRAVAKGVPEITLLDAEPSGNIVAFKRGVQTVRLTADGKMEKVERPPTESVERNQRIVRTRSGDLYSIAWGSGWLDHIPTAGKRDMLKLPGLTAPSCLTLWPDEGQLVIGEADGPYLWAVRIEKDGSFGPGDRYYSLRVRKDEKMHVTAMTMDARFLLYACTPLGVQIFDPTGRLSGVVPAPSKDVMTAIAIGGEKANMLFVAAGDKIYARPIQGNASYTLKAGK